MKEIPLTQGKVAIVDDSDYEAVSRFKWHAHESHGNWYAARNVTKSDGSRRLQFLHHFLMPEVEMIDHWDGDGLNNQRYNLRPCTHSQNAANKKSRKDATSNFLGVSWDVRGKNWRAKVKFEGKEYCLGSFKSEEDAARAYDEAARRLHKDFARPNFPSAD